MSEMGPKFLKPQKIAALFSVGFFQFTVPGEREGCAAAQHSDF